MSWVTPFTDFSVNGGSRIFNPSISAIVNTPVVLPGSRADDIEGLSWWLDASQEDSFTLDGNLVTQWDDLSGNDYHVSQSVTGDKPSRDGSINGRDTVRFQFSRQHYLSRNDPTFSSASGEFFVVLKPAAVSDTVRTAVASSDTGANNSLSINIGDVAGQRDGKTNMASLTTSLSSFSYKTFTDVEYSTDTLLLNFRAGGKKDSENKDFSWSSDVNNSGLFDINSGGKSQQGTWFSGVSSRDNLSVGALLGPSTINYFDGQIAEVIYYDNKNLSASERESLVTHLGAKWDIDVGASGDDPGITHQKDIFYPDLWLASNEDVTITTSGNFVEFWGDRSGGPGTHFEQTGDAQKPTYDGLINNRSSIQFDGSQYLIKNSNTYTSSSGEFFVVATPANEDGTSKRIITSNDTSNNGNRWDFVWGNIQGTPERVGLLTIISSTTSLIRTDDSYASGTYLFNLRGNHSTNTWDLELNGSGVATTQTGTGGDIGSWFNEVPSRDNVVIGGRVGATAGGHWVGHICEVIYYDARQLTSSERSTVEAYLTDKWGI